MEEDIAKHDVPHALVGKDDLWLPFEGEIPPVGSLITPVFDNPEKKTYRVTGITWFLERLVFTVGRTAARVQIEEVSKKELAE